MKQRIVIAIALACSPSLVIADEPTTALDVTIQAQVLAMMSSLRDKLGMAMILITHDLGVVAETCDNVAVMYAGEIIEAGTMEDIFGEDKRHPLYRRALRFHTEPGCGYGQAQAQNGLMPDSPIFPSAASSHRVAPSLPSCARQRRRFPSHTARTWSCATS